MASKPLFNHLWIIGPGRMGLGIGWCLAETGSVDGISVIGRSEDPPDHPLLTSAGARYFSWDSLAGPTPSLVLITVPDRSIGTVATLLADRRLPPVPVLHTSGVYGSEILAALATAGHATGSIHALTAVTRSLEDARKLISAWYAIEGDETGIRAAQALAQVLKGKTLRVEASRKPSYHAAAVFASNYIVSLLAVAERLMERAGVSPVDAHRAVSDLARGAVESAADGGVVSALTGPVSRGDSSTLQRHLLWLSPEERSLYSDLAREALALARKQGLDPEAARKVVDTLSSGTA